jgi:iron(III) transport system ATP-binding protein
MTDQAQTASISLQQLSKRFGAATAVSDVSLTVRAGTLMCLLGPSGCGKTTTLRMVGGFEAPTAGRILIGQDDLTTWPPYARPTAMVFQSYALFPHMSVYDNIAYGLRARRLPNAEIEQRVREAARLMELEGQERKAPPQLSGGQQQRVALARALVIRPKVLLFDEPLSNLDAQLRVRMRGEIRAVQRRLGITSLYVTHDQEEAFSIADEVAIMYGGRLIQVGSPRDLYYCPADRFVAEFVGLSNIVPAELVQAGPAGAAIRVSGQVLQSRQPPRDPRVGLAVVLRPEALRLAADGETGVPGRIVSTVFVGPLVRYTVAVNDGTQLVVDHHNPAPHAFHADGTAVMVKLPGEVPSVLG